jgi:iron complex outermembrane receptor protein
MFILPGDSLLNRYVSDQLSTSLTTNIQQNFIGDFNIGKFRNRVVAGIDFYSTSTINGSSAYILFDTVNAFHPDAKYTQLSRVGLEARFAQNNNPIKTTVNSNTYSAYVSNVFNITEQIFTMLSLRVDHFDNKGIHNQRTNTTTGTFKQTAFSPKLGLVYQVVKDKISVFANYMNGFRNVAAVTQPDGSVSNFKPQHANHWEGGMKMDLIKGKLAGTLSYYNVNVTNIIRPDPEKVGYSVQDGNAISKGFEADIIANPFQGLNIIAGYSFNHSRNDKTDSASIGRRPVSAGPEHLVNAWMSYNLVKGPLKGFGIGFGGNYASENKITNSSVTGVFTLPDYIVLNASIFYNVKAFRFGVKVDNLADKKYWKGWTTVEPQQTRRVSANLVFKF